MRIFEIDSQTTLEHILKELQTTEENGLELSVVPDQTNLLENPLNKKIIEKVAHKFKKEVVFPTLPIEQSAEAENDDLGFVEGEDIVTKVPMEEVDKMIAPAANISTKPVGIKRKTSPFKFNFRNKWLFLGGGLLILFLIFGLGLFFLPSAVITISLNSQTKEAQATLIADTSVKTVAVTDSKLPLTSKEISKEAEDQIAASGKKTVGTVAKGRVTITNQDSNNAKTFLAGTVITPVATSSVTFKLDNDVSVPKPSFGQTTAAGVNVTAVVPGATGNLPAGTYFKVNSLDSLVFAQNDVAFSGGATKQITVASVDDKNTLRAKIVDNLSKDAESQLTSGSTSNLTIKDGLETSVSKETYTPSSLDSETTTLKADIQVKSKVYLVNKEDLKKVLLNKLKSDSSDFKINEDDLSLTAELVSKENDNSLKITGKVKAILVPKLNEKDIVNHLKGKSLGEVKNYLNGIKNINEFKVDLAPSFFRILGIMPFFASKIKISYN